MRRFALLSQQLVMKLKLCIHVRKNIIYVKLLDASQIQLYSFLYHFKALYNGKNTSGSVLCSSWRRGYQGK